MGDIYRPRFAHFGLRNFVVWDRPNRYHSGESGVITGLEGHHVAEKLPVVVGPRGDNPVLRTCWGLPLLQILRDMLGTCLSLPARLGVAGCSVFGGIRVWQMVQ
jgi:hypothetical protein